MSGVYKITNLINGKCYIGLSLNIERRFMEHRTPKNLRRRTNLAKAFRKYGLENFSFEILEECNDEKRMSELEMYYIAKYKAEYNMNEGGLGNRGLVFTDDVKKVLSQKGKQQWARKTEEEKLAIVKNNLKRPEKNHLVSEATREKLRQINLGKKYGEAAKAKRSASNKIAALGNQNGNKAVVSLKDGIIIKEYLSMVLAAKDLGIHPTRITHVLKGRRKTTAGYEWKYKITKK